MRAIVVCGFLIKSLKKHILKIWKKLWVPFGSYLLNSTANSAQFEWKWAGFNRQLLNGTHIFFQIFRIWFFKDFIRNPQTTIALTFLTHIISDIDGVRGMGSWIPEAAACTLLIRYIRENFKIASFSRLSGMCTFKAKCKDFLGGLEYFGPSTLMHNLLNQ